MRRGFVIVGVIGIYFCCVMGAVETPAQIETSWVSHYGGSGQGGSVPDAIAADSEGNVYVTGRSWNGSAFDQVLLKYDPEGCLVWERRYPGPADFGNKATSLCIDRSGDICITGANAYGGPHHGYCVVRYDRHGSILTEDWHDWPEAGPAHIEGLQPDGAGGLYVIGLHVATDIDSNYMIMRFSGSGRLLWTEPFEAAGSTNIATALQTDGAGNVYVTGEIRERTGSRFLTTKYNCNGDLLWKDRFSPAQNRRTVPRVVRVSAGGQVYVAGCSHGRGPDCDIILVKYGPTGRLDWSRTFSSSGRSPDRVAGMEIDSLGNVYVAGISRGEATDFDYVTLKYSAQGELLWKESYDSPSNSRDQARALVVDHQGNAYVTGASWINGFGYSFVTLKYRIDGSRGR